MALVLAASIRPALFLAAESPAPESSPRFLGAPSCSSSACHGGAGRHQDQFHIWSLKDFHSRAAATLYTARSARIAETLRIENAASSSRCTECHDPFQTVPPGRLSTSANPPQGVSCETCHNPAEPWLRSHTRPDYSTAQRVLAGLRDLKTPSVRATTCVACHQVMDAALLRAGHPELLFELDGQTASMPRHWSKEKDLSGPQLWLAGQAAALREMSWQLLREENPEPRQVESWQGLAWLLQQTLGALPAQIFSGPIPTEPAVENFRLAQQTAGQLAASLDTFVWTPEVTGALLKALAGTAADFRVPTVPQRVQARRAERLALGLDRLARGGEKNHAWEQSIKALFQSIQSLPDFSPAQFAEHLQRLSEAIPGLPPAALAQ